MLNRAIAFAAGILLSFNASAGYIQYDLTGEGVTGTIVQHDHDRTIAYYNVSFATDRISADFFPSGYFANLSHAWSTRKTGPVNFQAFEAMDWEYRSGMAIVFYSTKTPGMYAFGSGLVQITDSGNWGPITAVEGSASGIAMEVAVDPLLAAHIDAGQGYPDGINRIEPRVDLPEPAGFALIGIGALAALGASRRRKRA